MIPPEQDEDVVVIPTLHIVAVHGYWEVRDETNTLVDRPYGCLETDTIRGCIEVTIHDSVAFDPEFLRSAVVAFELAYTEPDADGGDLHFVPVTPDYYTLATNEQGQNIMTVCGPGWGINGEAFHHAPLIPGTYDTYITASVHFLFDIWLTLAWTFGNSIEVISCAAENQPVLLTIPEPPNPLAGDEIYDTAQLLEGIEPTGSLHFQLWEDPEETSLLFEQFIDVEGNGTYETDTYTIPEDVPWPAGFHWHWKVHYSGDDNNNDADSGNEPVDIVALTGSPSGADEFAFIETAEINTDHPGAPYPLIALFPHDDLGQMWVIRTDTDARILLDDEDKLPVGPSAKGHVCVNGPRHWSEILNQAGAHIYELPLVDEIAREVPLVMGSTYRTSNDDLYMCGTPKLGINYSPFDICNFPDDSGILAAIVPSAGVLEFRKYSYDGTTVIDKWTMATDNVLVEDNWYLQPVKISITCDSSTVYYTFANNKVFRYNLDTRTQLSNYLTLPPYVGYLYGDLQCLKGADDTVGLVLAMTRSGQGPLRGVAVGPANTVWNDLARPTDGIWRTQKRNLATLALLGQFYFEADDVGENDEILGISCNFDACSIVSKLLGFVTLIGAT